MSAPPPAAVPSEGLNARFLGLLVLVALVAGGAWYAAHRFQVRRHAAGLVRQADAAESQDRPDRAARYLRMYLGFSPEDVDARVRYGELLDKMASSRPAREEVLGVFEQVLIRDPKRQAVRRRAAALAIEAGRFDEAAQHADLLLTQVGPADPEAQELAGRAAEGRGQLPAAVRHYEAAVQAAPARGETRLRLARLFRDKLNRPADADGVMAALAAAAPNSADALVSRIQYRLDQPSDGRPDPALDADVAAALAVAPDDPEVLLAAAEVAARVGGRADQARARLKRVAELRPLDVRGYELLAQVELAAGRPTAAADAFRAGLAKLPFNTGLTWNLANLLVRANDPAADGLIDRLAGMPVPAARVDFLRAAALVSRGDWTRGREKVEAVRPLLADAPELVVQADLLLARCAAGLDDPEGEVRACRRALAINPGVTAARVQAAAALARLNRFDEAAEETRRATEGGSPPADAWLLAARLSARRNELLPAAQRRWEETDEAVVRAEQAGADPAEVAVLRAAVLAAKPDLPAARAVLDAARAKVPKAGLVWLSAVNLALVAGDRPAAERLMGEADASLGDGADLRLVRLRAALDAPEAEAGPRLAAVEAGADRLPADQQARLYEPLAEAHRQFGRTADARRLWDRVAALRPKDLDVWLRVFDLALEAGDEPAMDRAQAATRELEGPGRPFAAYNQARRLIRKVEKGDKGAAADARAALAVVEAQRPGWARVSVCLGQLADLEDDPTKAIEHYLRAVERGDLRIDLVRRVVRKLHEQRRFTDAELIVRRLPENSLATADVQRLMAELSLRNGEYGQALAEARKAAAGSREYRDLVWLGQILWAAAQEGRLTPADRQRVEKEAEDALTAAAKQAPAEPDAWVVLVNLYVRTRRPEQAAAAIEQARAALPPAVAPLALAQCYDAARQPQKAREQFAAALAAKPDDPAALRVAADFYLRSNDLADAERCLRKLAAGRQDSTTADWAGSVLAVVLASTGDPAKAREAVGLLKPAEGAAGDAQQGRTRAIVLALQKDPAAQQQAIAVLEEMNDRQQLTPEDRFLLVQLYDRVGDKAKARERMLPLVAAGDNPRYMAYFADWLLLQGKVDEADRWAGTLSRAEPESVRTVTLRARVLAARGKGAEAAALLKPLAAAQEPPTALLIARLLEELNLGADAEPAYRAYAKAVPAPDGPLALTRYLGRQNRADEALAAADPVWAAHPTAAAEACLAALHATRGTAAQFARLDQRLRAAVQAAPGPALTLCQADLADLRGDYPTAEKLYRQVIQADGRNLVALNNLAGLLAWQGRGEEAVVFAGRAVEVGGPIPELLDTRAVAQLAAGRPQPALDDLKQALAAPVSDRRVRFAMLFHAALAQHRVGNRAEAAKAWKEAAATKCTPDDLVALERPSYDQLLTAYGRP